MNTMVTIDGIAYTFRRGFVASVSCRLEDWIGRECPVCDGQGKHRFPYGYITDPCGTCHGIGRIDAHGIEIVKVQPVTEVVLTDRPPAVAMTAIGGRWWWLDARIPVEIIDAANRNGDSTVENEPVGYPSEERAVSGMSAALVAWARDKAGLTKLEVHSDHKT